MSEDICKKLIEKESNLAIVGLGYVGMPIAVAFADRGVNVIGYDSNEEKISLYKRGVDPTNEVGDDRIKKQVLDSPLMKLN